MYREAEVIARAKRVGLWVDPDPATAVGVSAKIRCVRPAYGCEGKGRLATAQSGKFGKWASCRVYKNSAPSRFNCC